MHQILHAIRTGFISITVNNNDKYIFFWGLSVGYQHFKYTFNQGGNLPLVLCLLLMFSAWEAVSCCPKWNCLTQPADNFGWIFTSSPNLVSSVKLHQPTPVLWLIRYPGISWLF